MSREVSEDNVDGTLIPRSELQQSSGAPLFKRAVSQLGLEIFGPQSSSVLTKRAAPARGSKPPMGKETKVNGIVVQTADNMSPTSRMREENRNRQLTDKDISQMSCRRADDCPCKTSKDWKPQGSSTSCINRKCSCNNKVIGKFADVFIESIRKMGESGIMKTMSGIFSTFQTIKEIIPQIARVFGPEAKAAAEIAIKAVPDMGPSWIEKATSGAGKAIWDMAKKSPI